MARGSNSQGLVWHWTQETWSWIPSRGQWQAKHGIPKGVACLEISTEALPPKERYDFWRETVFYNFEADKGIFDEKIGFRARATGLISPRGDFFVFQSDRVSGRRTPAQARRDEGRDIELGVVVAGTRRHILQNGACLRAKRGQPFVYDPDHPSEVRWSAHRGANLKLRRKAVESAIGGRLPPQATLVRAIADSHLWPFLRAQLTLLSRRITEMSAASQSVLLENTIDLALATLREAVSPESSLYWAESRDALFVAAKRYIEAHLDNPHLEVDDVARAVACSRSTLYRIFAEHELTVAGYIRALRLQKFTMLLRNAGEGATVSELAERCGVLDPKTLSKLFRERHGISPREALELRILR